jgi:two-component system nitrogen regulation response regulator GlnG
MSGETILVADDDAGIRTVIEQALARAGYRAMATPSADALWQWAADDEGDLVITDIVMPDGDGLDLLDRIKKIRPDLPIIVMSARSTLLTAVRATERGAFEFLPKPFDINDLLKVIKSSFEEKEKPGAPVRPLGGDEQIPLVGRSPAMQEVYRLLARVVGTDLPVLVTGESGTGKELVARALHDYGKRRGGPFVAINMAAIPRELVESELFGHERGAFTGAAARSIGRFVQANGGTLFLDEIGDMPIDAQTRLLRVLQQSEVSPIGGRKPVRVDVRIISAANRDLRQAVLEGRFREDLFYRLNVVPIRLPALRERKEDIPDLVRHFLSDAVLQGMRGKAFEPKAVERLKAHDWPGNVRELENLVRRLVAVSAEDVIGEPAVTRALTDVAPDAGVTRGRDESLSETIERHLQRYFSAHGDNLPPSGLYDRLIREVERPLIALSLAATRGNQIKAARLLGLNRNTLRKKIRDLDLAFGRDGRTL